MTALAGFVLQQSALKAGVLAPAIASSNAATLLGSIAFGVTVFGETLSEDGSRLPASLIGLAMAVAGIVLLARSDSSTASGQSSSRGGSMRR